MMDSQREEESVSEWLGQNDEFARSFVDEYIHSHPLFLKELVQKEMDKRQQQMLFPISATSSITLPQLSPTHSSSVRHATVGSTTNLAAAACKTRRKSTQQLRALSKQELLMELLKDVVTPHFDVNSMSHKILVDVLILTNADRSSLFLVEGSSETPILVSRLFDVTETSTLESVTHDESEAIKIPFGSGIVGKVAKTGLPIVLEDAYQDSRFNPKVDTLTGYHTKAIMCLPIKTADNTVLGVAQVINKKGGGRDYFSQEDQEVFRTYLAFCAIGLVNVHLLDQSYALSQQLQILLHLARGLFEEGTSLPKMIKRIMSQAQELIPCRKALVLLLQKPQNEGDILFNQAFELKNSCNSDDNDKDELKIVSPSEVEGLEVALEVARTKKFFSSSSAVYGIQFQEKASSMLCMPIFDAKETEIGVVIIKDKLNGLPFNKTEVEAFRVFGTFCGLGVQNVLNYEEIFKANAKQSVALEVLSYHATASDEDTLKLLQRGEQVTTESALLHTFEFDDLILSDDETVMASVRMFIDLGLVSRHRIDLMCLYKWVLTVKKNYRPVTYHNWRHAFNVAQCMYSMITSGGMAARLSDLEQLGLMIACLCHDLDHRGTNNAFQAKTDSPLAQLYTTSTMEHHHFDHCIMILNSQGNKILSNLSTEDYETVIRLLENAILSTDLALYFKKKGHFTDLVKKEEFQWNDPFHRDMLRGMMMTACDVAAITKPWPIQQRVAELVASEFFEQGDKERHDLNLEPIAMMDRRKKDDLPKMQVGFIDSICLSLYDSLRLLEPKLTPLHDGCRANRGNWQSLADSKTGAPLTILVTPPTPTSLTSTNTPTLVTGTSTQSLKNGSMQQIEATASCDQSNNEQLVKTSSKRCTIT